jgi:uncharacterized protein (AIM24 family)
VYTAADGAGEIAFNVKAPGEILAVELGPGKSIAAQNGAYVASELDVNIEIAVQKVGVSLFGGEGFFLQKFSGTGVVFLEIDGSLVEYDLKYGEKLTMDTGAFAAAESSVEINVETVKGIGNIIAGGEGMFLTTATGPGKVWLQTMPLLTFSQSIASLLKNQPV